MHIPEASDPVSTIQTALRFREPMSNFPDTGKEAKEIFILGIKHEAPFEWYDLACGQFSLHFQKTIVPPEASYAENVRKHYPGGFPLAKLTRKQGEFIKHVLGERKITIPRQQNPAYRGPETDVPEFFPAYEVAVGDHIICRPLNEYNPVAEYYATRELPPEPDEGQKLTDAVYDAQKSGKSKRQ